MDLRAIRTRQALRDALVSLATEIPFDEIRVQDLLDRSGVGRTAFYSHFRDKEDLLVTLFLEMMDRIDAEADWESELILPTAERLFEHFLERIELCGGLRRADKMLTLHLATEARLRQTLEARFARRGLACGSLAAAHAAASFVNLWKWWVMNGRRLSPSDMARIYQDLVEPGIATLAGALENQA